MWMMPTLDAIIVAIACLAVVLVPLAGCAYVLYQHVMEER